MVSSAAVGPYASPARRPRHIVDTLIEERAPKLSSSPAWPLVRPALYALLDDKPWAPSALSIARKYEAPVVPLHVAGPWATLFHLFDRVSGELRDITLFHELLNKKGGRFSLSVGEPLNPASIENIEALKHHVERGFS